MSDGRKSGVLSSNIMLKNSKVWPSMTLDYIAILLRVHRPRDEKRIFRHKGVTYGGPCIGSEHFFE